MVEKKWGGLNPSLIPLASNRLHIPPIETPTLALILSLALSFCFVWPWPIVEISVSSSPLRRLGVTTCILATNQEEEEEDERMRKCEDEREYYDVFMCRRIYGKGGQEGM